MSRILICLNQMGPDKRAELCGLIREHGDEPIVIEDMNPNDSYLEDIDAVIGNISIDALHRIHCLKWVQFSSSGVDAYIGKLMLPDNVILTCATGAYGTGIAEYMITQLLVMMKRIPTVYNRGHLLLDNGTLDSPMGKRVLVVGAGNIGTEFARRIQAFGAEVVGIRRRSNIFPEGFSEIYPMEGLRDEVQRADVIALTLASTPLTHHLFNREVLSCCKKGAYLINVGRGDVIDEDALADKQIHSNFTGIYLDVQENPDDSSRLQGIPNLIHTPHIAGKYLEVTNQQVLNICKNNYLAFKGKGEFVSVVDRKSGYAL